MHPVWPNTQAEHCQITATLSALLPFLRRALGSGLQTWLTDRAAPAFCHCGTQRIVHNATLERSETWLRYDRLRVAANSEILENHARA